MRRAGITVAAVLSCWGHSLQALAAGRNPPVPPGIDPGGVAVAIIASGIDYTQTFIAARLARDGEGELIGWDLVDNDRRPFEEHNGLEKANTAGRDMAMPQTLLKRAPGIRIAPFRIDTDDAQSVHKGLALAAMTPAKIVVLDLKSSTATVWATVREDVIRSGGKFLLVVAAGEGGSDADRIKEHLAPAVDDLDSLLIVTPCVRDGAAVAGAPDAPVNADIAVNVEASTSEGLPSDAITDKPAAGIASAEVAAMAAAAGQECKPDAGAAKDRYSCRRKTLRGRQRGNRQIRLDR